MDNRLKSKGTRRATGSYRASARTAMNKYVTAMVDVASLRVQVTQGEPLMDDAEHEAHLVGMQPIVLKLMQGSKWMMLDLSLMTVDELAATKAVLDSAFASATPVAIALDAFAQEQFDKEEEMIPMRFYRMVPTVIIRRPYKPKSDPIEKEPTHANDRKTPDYSEDPDPGF